jgi:hypothetical protein
MSLVYLDVLPNKFTHCTSTAILSLLSIPSIIQYPQNMSFISDVMAPGGGVLLLPFVRVVIAMLLVCTIATFLAGVARIHMAILSFLSAGLLFSLHMFENAYNNLKQRSESSSSAPPVSSSAATQEFKWR